jgi:hypothetical protein
VLLSAAERVAAVAPMWQQLPHSERVQLLTVDLDTLRQAAKEQAEQQRAYVGVCHELCRLVTWGLAEQQRAYAGVHAAGASSGGEMPQQLNMYAGGASSGCELPQQLSMSAGGASSCCELPQQLSMSAGGASSGCELPQQLSICMCAGGASSAGPWTAAWAWAGVQQCSWPSRDTGGMQLDSSSSSSSSGCTNSTLLTITYQTHTEPGWEARVRPVAAVDGAAGCWQRQRAFAARIASLDWSSCGQGYK